MFNSLNKMRSAVVRGNELKHHMEFMKEIYYHLRKALRVKRANTYSAAMVYNGNYIRDAIFIHNYFYE